MALSDGDNLAIEICSLFLGFIIVSGLFLRFRGKGYAKKSTLSQQLRETVVIGHRGSKLEGYCENTVHAFQRALDVGVDMIELDVWLTKDKQVVVFHDGTFKRMCGGIEGHVNDLPFAELPPIVPTADQINHPDGCRIPLFTEVLDLIPDGLGLIVEVKQESKELFEMVVDLLNKHNRITNGATCWFSLKKKVNNQLQKFEPLLPTICSVEELLITYVLYFLCILPFVPVSFQIFGMAADNVDAERIKDELPVLPMWACRFLNLLIGGRPSKLFMQPKLIDHFLRRGMCCWLLGVNEDCDIDVIPRLHATGALTDKPEWMKFELNKPENKRKVSTVTDNRI